MPALINGAVAPDFSLRVIGGEQFSLKQALKNGPVVAAFFKISCPVCQYAFPFLERLYQAYRGKNVTMVGVSQNDAGDTQAFMKQYGITFAVLLDDPARYPVSNAYGITNVPTIFFISPEGEVEQSIVGWDRQEMEQLSHRIGGVAGLALVQIFRPGEDVAEFKAG